MRGVVVVHYKRGKGRGAGARGGGGARAAGAAPRQAMQIYHASKGQPVAGRVGVLAVPHSETGYTRRPVTAGVTPRRAVPAGRAEMNPRRGGWLQARERPKGRLPGPSRRKGRGPGGSSPKTEHPRFLVHVADLARLEMGPFAWAGTGGPATMKFIGAPPAGPCSPPRPAPPLRRAVSTGP